MRVTVSSWSSTRNVTVPLPLPDAPLLIVSHASLLDAVHSQPVPAVTDTVLVPVPVAATAIELGATVTWQEEPADCVTDTAVPAIVTTAEREDVPVFGVAVTV